MICPHCQEDARFVNYRKTTLTSLFGSVIYERAFFVPVIKMFLLPAIHSHEADGDTFPDRKKSLQALPSKSHSDRRAIAC